jgi:glycosyltransferase involved in cell wall biosynthesis
MKMESSESRVPLVSVWMLTYNHEKYIARAIESVLMQKTGFPIELVIGEDCSKDGTRAIVRDFEAKYPDIIVAVYQEKNVGVMRNSLDYTFPLLRGKYIAILEGDDYWTDPQKLSKQVAILESNPQFSSCFHEVLQVNESTGTTFPIVKIRQQRTFTTDDLLKKNRIPTCSVIYRNNWGKRLPDWLRKLELGDWPMNILNSLHGDIVYLPDVMAVYRVHSGSGWSSSLDNLKGKERTTLSKLNMFRELQHAVDPGTAEKISARIREYEDILALYRRIIDRGMPGAGQFCRLVVNTMRGKTEYRTCLIAFLNKLREGFRKKK